MAEGTAARRRCSAASIASATSAAVSRRPTAIFAATSSSSGPTCRVRRWMTRSMSGSSARAVRISASSSGSAPSPTSMLDTSKDRKTAITTSSTPIAIEPRPSQRPSPVTTAIVTPKRAKARPIRAPVSSSRTTGSSGWRASRTNCDSGLEPRDFFDSRKAVRSENDSSTMATNSTPKAHCGWLSSSGNWNLWKPSYSAKRPPTRNKMIDTTKA